MRGRRWADRDGTGPGPGKDDRTGVDEPTETTERPSVDLFVPRRPVTVPPAAPADLPAPRRAPDPAGPTYGTGPDAGPRYGADPDVTRGYGAGPDAGPDVARGYGAGPDYVADQDAGRDVGAAGGVDLFGDPITHPRPAPAGTTERPGRWRRLSRTRKALVGTAALLVLLLVSGAVTVQVLTNRVLGDVQRIPDVFSAIDESTRPQKPAGTEKTLNFLLVGVDTRADEQTTGSDGDGAVFVPGRQRSDVIMVVHVSADRRTASVVSLPRDSWVAIPGRGRDKINAAYSSGGGSLLVRTVEGLTGLRIDHFAVVDFAGFKDITNAVGGVDVQVREATGDRRGMFPAGLNHLDGDQALVYVRQRYNLPQGDLDRVRRQQNVIKALMTKAGDRGMLANPPRALRLADSVARAVSVDDSLSNGDLRSLVLSLRGLRPGAVKFVTAPVRGFGREGRASVVYLDGARAGQLWTAIAKDDVAGYVRTHPKDALDANPR